MKYRVWHKVKRRYLDGDELKEVSVSPHGIVWKARLIGDIHYLIIDITDQVEIEYIKENAL